MSQIRPLSASQAMWFGPPRERRTRVTRLPGPAVLGQQRGDGQIGQDVAVVNEKRPAADQIGHVFDSPAGFQEHRFMPETDGPPTVGAFRKSGRESLRQVVRVDHELLHPGVGDQVVERERDQRLVAHRDERLGQLVGQRPQPRAQAGREDERFLDRGGHGRSRR